MDNLKKNIIKNPNLIAIILIIIFVTYILKNYYTENCNEKLSSNIFKKYKGNKDEKIFNEEHVEKKLPENEKNIMKEYFFIKKKKSEPEIIQKTFQNIEDEHFLSKNKSFHQNMKELKKKIKTSEEQNLKCTQGKQISKEIECFDLDLNEIKNLSEHNSFEKELNSNTEAVENSNDAPSIMELDSIQTENSENIFIENRLANLQSQTEKLRELANN